MGGNGPGGNVLGGNVLGGKCPGGKCPGGNAPGGKDRVGKDQGGKVLESTRPYVGFITHKTERSVLVLTLDLTSLQHIPEEPYNIICIILQNLRR